MLEEVKKKCLESNGFVIFVGTIDPFEVDENKNPKINWDYSRIQMNLEDAREGVRIFRDSVANDFQEGFE